MILAEPFVETNLNSKFKGDITNMKAKFSDEVDPLNYFKIVVHLNIG